MKKLVQKSLILIRCKLGIKRYPVGFDSFGNCYYDNGLMRRVVIESTNSSSLTKLTHPVVSYEHSKWLNYEIDEFPYECDSKVGESPRFYFAKLSDQDKMAFRLGEKELDHVESVYKPSLESFLVIRFGQKPYVY